MRFAKIQYGCLMLAVAGALSVVQATTISWNNKAGGDFSNTANWTAGLLPGVLDSALFNTASTDPYTVTFSSNPSNNQLLVGNDNVTLDLRGHTYALTDWIYSPGVSSAQIGSINGGTLNLENTTNSVGQINSVFVSIGSLLGETGTLNITGSKAQWNSSQDIQVGDAGIGNLTIKNGADVTDSAGSLGNTASGVGAALVDGAGSSWTNNSYLYIGDYGTGSLRVQNGATVSNDVTYVGNFGPGSATITGAGSTLSTDALTIANNGNGNLQILDGAALHDSNAYISSYPGVTGNVTIDGANSTWATSAALYVGTASAGVLNINNGLVTVGQTLGIANKAGTQVNLSGGTLRIGSLNTSSNPSLFLGNQLTTGWTGGTLDITRSDLPISSSGPLGSTLVLSPGKILSVSGSGRTLSIAQGASLNAAGGSVYANTLNNAGTLSVPSGSSVEVVNPLINTGFIDVSGGTLQLDAGVTAGDSVRAELQSAFDHGHWDGTSGIGSSLAAADPLSATGVAYLTSGATTKLAYTWYGDANGDGVVNQADLAMISSSGTNWQTGDFNYDGVVNADDWALFQLGAIYGGSTKISTQLPEPGSIALISLVGLLTCRRRRRS